MIQENDLRITIFPFIQKLFAIPSLTMGSFTLEFSLKITRFCLFSPKTLSKSASKPVLLICLMDIFFFSIFSFGFMFLMSIQFPFIGNILKFFMAELSPSPLLVKVMLYVAPKRQDQVIIVSKSSTLPTVVQFRKEQATHPQ